MKYRRIWAIHSSKEICKAIYADCAPPPEVHLDFTAVRAALSLKKLFSARNNRASPLKDGDYIIAVDHAPSHVFQIDTQDQHLLHFTSLDLFMTWIRSYGEDIREEAMPLIQKKGIDIYRK